MGRPLSVRTLTAKQIAQAFPLVRAIVPDLTLENWLDYAKAIAKADGMERGGVVAAQDERGYIFGLFCYKIQYDICHGRTLAIENMVALDMVDRSGAMEALMGALDRIARQKGCQYVHIALPYKTIGHRSFLRPLREAGHEIDNIRLCKPVHKTASTAE